MLHTAMQGKFVDPLHRSHFVETFNVSRETLERFDLYAELLQKWQRTINLVSGPTLPDLWLRHFFDSAQVVDVYPKAKTWLDLGTGAGLPGLVIALLGADKPGTCVHLVEIDQRKCAFLHEVIRKTGAPAIVHQVKIENLTPIQNVDVVTSRALASLDLLLGWSRPYLKTGSRAIFLKGKSAQVELDAVGDVSDLTVRLQTSRTNVESRVVIFDPSN